MGIQSFPPKASYGSAKNKGTFGTTSSSYVTALSVTGSGCLKHLLCGFNSGSDQGFLRVVIDGVDILNGVVVSTSSTVYCNPFGASTTPAVIDLAFTTSLLIQAKTLNAVGTVSPTWIYELA